jgi:hypothetical protein
MSSLISETERQWILATFEESFDTWSRTIIVYKVPLKTLVTPLPSTTTNVFGFGESQQEPSYTIATQRTGEFPGIIKDSDIARTITQVSSVALSPEIMTRILASPISLKVREDCSTFIDDGETERIVDVLGNATYLLDGHGCLQTYLGSKYYVYPLRKTN